MVCLHIDLSTSFDIIWLRGNRVGSWQKLERTGSKKTVFSHSQMDSDTVGACQDQDHQYRVQPAFLQ